MEPSILRSIFLPTFGASPARCLTQFSRGRLGSDLIGQIQGL